MLVPVIPFWIVTAFYFLFRHEKFDHSTFLSSSFFALMGLVIAFVVIRIHFRFAEKIQLSRLEMLIMGFSVLCVVCWLTLLTLSLKIGPG